MLSASEALKLLVAIISCHANRQRRDAVRETWLTLLPEGTPHFFFVGAGDTVLEPDVLLTPAEDTRGGTAQKALFAYRHALANYTFDWMFRVDDDTFVVPERIHTLFWDAKAEMIGGDCMSELSWSTGGAGLLFTRRLVEVMVKRGIWEGCSDADDGWACACARDAGAEFYWTPRLRHEGDLRPHPHNDMVTGHYVSPEEMHVLHDRFHSVRASTHP